METIELGKSYDGPESIQVSVESDKEVYYPHLYIDGVEGLKKTPEEGEALIKFKRKSKTIREDDGKKSCSVELEIRSIAFKEEPKPVTDRDAEFEATAREVMGDESY